jgi:hypothetical protein
VREPAVEAYFSALRDTYASGAGVAETTYYPALRNLLDSIGSRLKPKVTAIINLRNTGGGIPDGGLFTAQQLKGWEHGTDPLAGQLPARGAIEVKGTKDDVFLTATGEQVARYVERYGLVLVTNLRDFALVGRSPDGSGTRILETLQLAKTEAGFWAKVQQPRKYAEDAGEGLTEFLRRVLLHDAPLVDPKDVAWFLASYARTARLRLEQKSELPALAALRSQLEDSLGLKFEGEKGEHFFRSTLVQTLFYGMFASWVLWSRGRDYAEQIPWDRRFQWETATMTLHVPMVYELFRQFADVHQLGALGISEVLEWAEEVLWRIDRRSFFEKFQEHHAVQYFYEPFLEAFDPDLRKELGVWYTPEEVVKYMVARVDWALRHELGIADGLADPSVVVLDPCCGTGTYLVEVLRTIDRTLTAKGADALTRQDVKVAALSRIIGFEIMPAPFVIAHLQLGILLAELGVPLKDADERAAVYLTNALTGWKQADRPKPPRVGALPMYSTLLYPEFAHERDEANRIKREEQIIVILGNPPYNGYANVAVDEERELSQAYRTTKQAPKPSGQGLNDPYVRFYRMAERQIGERMRKGVVCLISNNSWLDKSSFTGMREHLLEVFDRISIDNLNGDKYSTGKTTPDGRPDPSIFSTETNREGIQVGTAIAVLIKGTAHTNSVDYLDWWGPRKRADLLAAATEPPVGYVFHVPVLPLGLPFRPCEVAEGYLSWPQIPDLFPKQFPGIITARDPFVVDIDRTQLEERLRLYFDPTCSDEAVTAVAPIAMANASRFDPVSTRRTLVKRGFLPNRIVDYQYRPFDRRLIYWEPETKLLHEKRAEYWPTASAGTPQLVMAQKQRRGFDPPVVTSATVAFHLLERGALAFPVDVVDASSQVGEPGTARANLSKAAAAYLSTVAVEPAALFWHSVAVLHSRRYFAENQGALELDWPRLPLPRASSHLLASAALGRRVAGMLDGQTECPRLALGPLTTASGETLNLDSDLAVTAHWGIAGKGGITMPSTGKLTERLYNDAERAAIEKHAILLGMSGEQAVGLLGNTCLDVYLNDVAYWRCVPAAVYRYTIGGYPVIKKWLSYRERALLGRDLKPEEARYVTGMVRRIAALVLMQPELDANYERVMADVWEWNADAS